MTSRTPWDLISFGGDLGFRNSLHSKLDLRQVPWHWCGERWTLMPVLLIVIYLRGPKKTSRGQIWGGCQIAFEMGPNKAKQKIFENLFVGTWGLGTLRWWGDAEDSMSCSKKNDDRINHLLYILLTVAWRCWMHSLPPWGLAMVPWQDARWSCSEWGILVELKKWSFSCSWLTYITCRWRNKDP